ncbi:hypothetical protein AGMMS49545_09300 [Betaproteobacteria bacterium]|nr:hypothetical protein AGMMS49545_09300 [Betaproteobacteria bacterium]GHU44168.1 hypothetical protein AGMMS50289_11900 [Betaproteobacteria bacterium]
MRVLYSIVRTRWTPEQLDEIARILSVYKDGDEVVAELRKLALPGGEKLIGALSEVSFNQFSNLSLSALRKIVPFMAQGQRYDEACVSAGYHHSQLLKPNDEKELYLPAFYENHRGTEPGEIGKLSGIPIRGGIAKNDSMLRVDVFTKAGKFHLVPVYVHHRIAGLPNRAIIQGKDEEKWTLIDESFDWCFSLHPNDLVRITTKKNILLGYYSGANRAIGSIDIWAHDRNQNIGKDGLIQSIGVKTAIKLEKFEVDVLGNIYPARPEPRRGLA